MVQECNIWHHPGSNSACLHQSGMHFFTWEIAVVSPFPPLPGRGRDFPFVHSQLSATEGVRASSAPGMNLLPWLASTSMFAQLSPRAGLQSHPSHQPWPEMSCCWSFHSATNTGQPLWRCGLFFIHGRLEVERCPSFCAGYRRQQVSWITLCSVCVQSCLVVRRENSGFPCSVWHCHLNSA